jgi:hypothetical protein
MRASGRRMAGGTADRESERMTRHGLTGRCGSWARAVRRTVEVPLLSARKACRGPSPCGPVRRRVRSVVHALGACCFVGALLPAAAWAEDDVLVNIRGPLVGRVGEKVSFDVELVNRSGRNLEKLRVIDYFDAGFRHEASASPIEQKGTIDLAVGTARRVTLEFILAEVGRQCHRVEILDTSQRFVGGATECVQVSAATPSVTAQPPAVPPTAAPSAPPSVVAPAPVAAPAAVAPPAVPPTAPPAVTVPAPAAALAPPPAATPPPSTATAPPLASASTSTAPLVPPAAPAVALDLTGPAEVLSGGVAAFVATVRNTGNGPSTASVLEFSWEDGFVPLEASDGYRLGPSKVSWTLPAVEPGAKLERQINLRAEAPADAFSDSPPVRSCIRSELTGLGGVVVGDLECVQIRSTRSRPRRRSPAEAGLRLSLADLDDPVVLGDATTLVCSVMNDGDAPSGPLNIVVDLPPGARLVGDARVRVDDGRVFLDAVEVPAGGRRSFEIAYTLAAAGRGTARATLSGDTLDGRLDRSCETEFLGR